MYQEFFSQHNNTTQFQISRINHLETLIVFFHGIGDSHLNFTCFFESPQLEQYDLFVADLLGHGRSSTAQNHTIATQVEALAIRLIPLVAQYKTVIFVPHSMGGIHATLLAANPLAHNVKGIFAIETSMTQYGSFIARRVSDAIAKDTLFSEFFHGFCDEIYRHAGPDSAIFRRYYAGLQFVRESTFLENALEMYALSTALKQAIFTNKMGEIFATLPIPKAYCLGDTGQQIPSIPFLIQNGIQIEYFNTNCHWVAQACFDDFCCRLNAFIQRLQATNG